jgi:uncharacterized protein (TIGR02266 family)
MSPKENNRPYPRRKIQLPVKIKLRTYDDFINTYVTDISAGGVFIATSNLYEVGDELDIEFYLEQQNTYFFKVQGFVVRLSQQPIGMGIKFTKIEESSQNLLEQLLERIPTNA